MDISFFFNFVEDDAHLVNRLLGQLNEFHPDSNVVAISDGPITVNVEPVNQNQNIIYGEHLKNVDTIGAYIKRNFQSVLNQTPATWIIKVDPDSYFLRPIMSIPARGLWVGNRAARITDYGHTQWIKGGAWAMHRSALQEIAESPLLDEPGYHYLHDFEVRYDRVYANFRMGHIAQRLGIEQYRWTEVENFAQPLAARPRSRAAVIHPVKTLEL